MTNWKSPSSMVSLTATGPSSLSGSGSSSGGAGLPKLGLHGLRTWATLVLLYGLPAKVVAEVLRHASITTTLDLYSHVTPGMQADATARVAGTHPTAPERSLDAGPVGFKRDGYAARHVHHSVTMEQYCCSRTGAVRRRVQRGVMSVGTKFRQTFDPVPGHAGRFTQMLRDLTPAELDAQVPGMTWTAADVGVHVLTVLDRYASNPTRSSTRQELTDQNESELRALDLTASEVADRIDAAVGFLSEVAPHLPLDQTTTFHLGLTVDIAAGWANLCSEFLVHGTDIANATGREWSFPDVDIEGIWRNLTPALAGWLRPEARHVDELYELRFRFGPVSLWIHDGQVTTDDATRPPDHVVDIDDAVGFTLGVPWRRALVTDPVAALLLSRIHDI